jgi:hypothetical protein
MVFAGAVAVFCQSLINTLNSNQEFRVLPYPLGEGYDLNEVFGQAAPPDTLAMQACTIC